ncbi:MAG: rod shape-determining protein MreC [Lentisphaerae bacterium]|nr:rod shape-determining protein MreC [Lentisphaerota bacterium]
MEEVVKNRGLIIGLVVFGLLVFLNLPLPVSMRLKNGTRDNIAPFQNVASLLLHKLRNVGSFLFSARKAIDEKQRMSEEIASLRQQLRDHLAAAEENAELRRLLGFKLVGKHTLIPCRVILRMGANGWWQTVTLDKGYAHGIKSGMGVITVDGLAGRTVEVSKFTSTVLLLADKTCKVSCKIGAAGWFGILSGGGIAVENPDFEMLYPIHHCQTEYISKDANINIGDKVLTSGLGGIYPEGLMIGHVTKVYEDVSGLYRRADVMPAADLVKLKYVFVVRTEDEIVVNQKAVGTGGKRP